MLLFHGTTIENAKQILKEGFKYRSEVWHCSEEKTYFFSEDYIRSSLGDENRELSQEEVITEGVRIAMQQARITLAVQNPLDYRGAVLVFDSSLMKNGEDLETDYSCDNMENVAVCIKNPDMAGLIQFYQMTESEACFRFFELAGYVNNPYRVELGLSNTEEMMLKLLNESQACYSYFELMNEREYLKINLTEIEGDLKAA